MRGLKPAAVIGLICFASDAVHAETFAVPPGPLGTVIAAIGGQANITLTISDARLAAEHSPGVHGKHSLRTAIALALRGTEGQAIFYDKSIIRIVARPPRPKPKIPAIRPAEPSIEPQPDIVVTASKQRLTVDRYPGSVKMLVLDPAWVANHAAGGTAAVTKLLPTLGSTNLGPGRDKLFIRGIADSSFNGPTQATTGQYLGDVRLTYNAPDPDLNLYDMKQVEVLVGPQGTLYGAGSLGGVLRFVPNVPDMQDLATTMSAGVATTAHGGISRDGAGMLNIPLIDDRLAVRFVVFGRRRAGYIDDPSRKLKDVNGDESYGERFSLRSQAAGWTIDLGFVLQNIAQYDGQYTLAGNPPLTRSTAIAQPFHNDYRLGYVRAQRAVAGADLISTTSVARHDLKTVFDATGYDDTVVSARFSEENDITLLSHETRLSGGPGRAPWVAGVSALYSASVISRTLGPLGAEERIAGVVNTQAEAALFGQIARPITSTLTGTVGERATFTHTSGFLIDNGQTATTRSSRDAVRLSGTLALDWRPGGSWSAFFHYQQGYRPGGLAIASSSTPDAGRKFVADDLNMNELGVRIGGLSRDRFSVRAAIFAADWNHIQADLVDQRGLPYTANIGRGRIYGLDGEITWQATHALRLTAAAFVNDSNLSKPEEAFANGHPQTLPNVSRGGGRIAAAWRKQVSTDASARGDASIRYVGRSHLGVGNLLDISQGGYFEVDAGWRVDWKRFGVSLDIDNVLDTTANTFAFGNPFGINQRNQSTPLRPRTIRLGVSARF